MGIKEVAAGAEWLDENFPGWEWKIDLETLDMANCRECVLGQSLREFVASNNSSGYGYGCALQDKQMEVGTSEWRLIAYAFVPDGGNNEGLWLDLIKERFSTGNLSDNDKP